MRTRGEVFVYPGPVIEPENDQRAWEKVWVEDWHFTPEHKPAPLNDYILRGNHTLVRELVAAIEQRHRTDREPARRRARHRNHPGRLRLALRRRKTSGDPARRPAASAGEI